MRPSLHRRLALSGTLIFLLVVAYGFRSTYLPVQWNPRFQLEALQGKTPDEVVKALGSPDFDPRVSTVDGNWMEDRDGPYWIAYYGRLGTTCTIKFKNDKVALITFTNK